MALILFILIVGLSLLPFIKGASPHRAPRLIAVGLLLATCAGAIALKRKFDERIQSHERMLAETPREDRTPFVNSRSCQACHPDEYRTWHQTYHRTMTQHATPESVVPDFAPQSMSLEGQVYRIERRDGEFWAEMPDPEWLMNRYATGGLGLGGVAPRVRRRIVMTTGSHHMQVYWISSGKGNMLYSFPFSFLFEEQRWVPTDDTFLKPPGPGSVEVWNHTCIRCHSVAGQPKEASDGSRRMQSQVAELGISCEACHGPGQEHIRLNRQPLRRYQYRLSGEQDPTMLNPRELDHVRSSEICGQCHSITQFRDMDDWMRHEGIRYQAGHDLGKTRLVVRHLNNAEDPELRSIIEGFRATNPAVQDGFFWRDGMMRVSGREYNGLIESACYQRGELSCLSCHSMHDSEPDDQLRRDLQGDATCLSCHADHGRDLAAHTFHAPDSPGSRCANCHMPHTTYGLLKAIRSHEIDSPNVAVDLQSGRPNACNLCHLDQTLAWTQTLLEQRYGVEPVAIPEDNQETAASLLWLVRGDAGQRALAAWHMGWAPAQAASGTNWMAGHLVNALEDRYSVVRFIAKRALGTMPGFADLEFDYVAPAQVRQRSVEALRKQAQNLPVLPTDLSRMLLDARGQPDAVKLSTLLQQRDHRRVELRE